MLALAFLLDLFIGDPVYRLHPVRLMGRAIEHIEVFLRRTITQEKIAGGILALFFPLLVFGSAWAVIFFLGKVHPWLAWIVSVFGIYSSLSIHDLKKEGFQIYRHLKERNIEEARKGLARIVGRDTDSLDESEGIRAAIETVAESTLDGIIAPLFYAALGGAPLALAYKAVNTLDSMIGHLNERYRNFGFVAAKQDEFWNWIPARLSYLAIALATPFVNGRFREACSIGWHDGITARNGNGAVPEAVFAGALDLRLGGTNFYEGRQVNRPFLGSSQRNFDCEDIVKSLKLAIATAWIFLLGVLFLKYGIALVGRS